MSVSVCDVYKCVVVLLDTGVKNMAKAYVHHSGGSKKESLSNVKSGFKECTQVSCEFYRLD